MFSGERSALEEDSWKHMDSFGLGKDVLVWRTGKLVVRFVTLVRDFSVCFVSVEADVVMCFGSVSCVCMTPPPQCSILLGQYSLHCVISIVDWCIVSVVVVWRDEPWTILVVQQSSTSERGEKYLNMLGVVCEGLYLEDS